MDNFDSYRMAPQPTFEHPSAQANDMSDEGPGVERDMARPVSHPIYQRHGRRVDIHPIPCWPYFRTFYLTRDHQSVPPVKPEATEDSSSPENSLPTSPGCGLEETTGAYFDTWPRNPGAVRGTLLPIEDLLSEEEDSLFTTGQWAKYKTELCTYFEDDGFCKRGPFCRFAHGPWELRPRQRGPDYKTALCKKYHKRNFCPYGKRCTFIH